jgi:hypothetical protein
VPVLGQSVTVAPVSGTVRVGLDSRTFLPLAGARQIPVGSYIDTRRGTVRLTTAKDGLGTLQSGRFSSGIFRVLQSADPSAKGLVGLRLSGGSFASCPKSGGGSASAAARRRRVVRRLRGNAHGRFKGSANHSSATVRGTVWSMDDRCDTTVTSVTSGVVAVRDFRRRMTVSVRRGERYVACAPGFRPRSERSQGRFRTCGRYSAATVRGG